MEKDDKKLDWMYKGPNQLINREEYLLGRPIDKSFEQIVQVEKNTEVNHTPRNHVEHECVPPSLRFFSGNEQVDLARKMQEDPLYAIKKKEMETRNQLLKNPVKLKQLRQLLEQQSEKDKNGRKQKKKKKKHKQDEDSEDEAQLDILLAAKYKQLKDKLNDKELIKSMRKIKHKRRTKSKKKNDNCSSISEDSSEESSDDENLKKHEKRKMNKNEENMQSNRSRKEKYIVIRGNKEKDKKQKVFETDYTRNRNSNSERNSAIVYEKTNKTDKRDTYWNNNFEDKSNPKYVDDKFNNRNTSDNYVQKKNKEHERNKDKWNLKRKHELTEEEKERRRQEMLTNATWREKERERNVKKYREEEKKEVDNSKVYNQDFIRKQLVTATEVSTVASRIKANINNIQRSGRAMDTNFAKR